MGNCAPIRSADRTCGLPGPECKFHSALEYCRHANILIKLRDENLSVMYLEKLICSLPEPNLVLSKVVRFPSGTATVSACVLPGIDPRGLIYKPCQDIAFFEQIEDAVLVGVYDGHGKYGQQVVKFCRNFMLKEFREKTARWKQNPLDFLVEATRECDRELQGRPGDIDPTYSGSTQVLYLVYQDTIHTACVGDSRLILATTKTFSAAEPPARGDDKEVLDRLKRRRSVPAAMALSSVQLTKDQKPEDPTERERILRMGGTVRRLMDEAGHNVGPWRVWRKNGNSPGLAMSRSLGDTVGSEIGVISEPMVSTHVLRAGYDFFLVSATDGVWDVMENQEVADYVEAYRWNCRKEVEGLEAIDKARPNNSTIAQLLCEEARVRWLTIVEEEDVLIDDISCVVVELMESHLRLARPPGRVNMPNLDAADVPNSHASIKASEVRVRDPRRASVSEAAD